MRRSVLLTASAAAIVASCTAGHAQSFMPNLTAPYVEFGGGFDLFAPTLTDITTNESPSTPPSVTSTTPGLGTNFHAAIGAALMPDLRGELGVSVTNGSSTFTVQAEGVGTVAVAAHTFTLMGDIWKDFELANNLGLHVGGGLGVGVIEAAATNDGTTTTLTNPGLAFMGGIGGDYHLANGMTLSLDYRLSGIFGGSPLGTVPITTSWGGETAGGTLGTTLDHAVTISLRIPIGG